jgi:hypothetical protein
MFENRKIRKENEILKANEPAPGVETSDLSKDTKKHTTKSRETSPLNKMLEILYCKYDIPIRHFNA